MRGVVVLLEVGDGDVGTFLGEGDRHRASDTGIAAGDQRLLAGEQAAATVAAHLVARLLGHVVGVARILDGVRGLALVVHGLCVPDSDPANPGVESTISEYLLRERNPNLFQRTDLILGAREQRVELCWVEAAVVLGYRAQRPPAGGLRVHSGQHALGLEDRTQRCASHDPPVRLDPGELLREPHADHLEPTRSHPQAPHQLSQDVAVGGDFAGEPVQLCPDFAVVGPRDTV